MREATSWRPPQPAAQSRSFPYGLTMSLSGAPANATYLPAMSQSWADAAGWTNRKGDASREAVSWESLLHDGNLNLLRKAYTFRMV